MIYNSKQMEESALLATAAAMCAAARTAPKGKGVDTIETLVLTGEEKDALADKMDEIARREFGGNPNCWYFRDAENLRAAQAVVLIGTHRARRGIPFCSFCGFENCAACEAAGGTCAFAGIDMGIAIGSACAVAADARVDNRIMFSIGKAAAEMGYVEGDVLWNGIPLSISGKSPFFDRK
ncbi:MAG: hypothetical protein IKU10_07200 [Clostridia bacterium]|nr:hypothetical protein [Clostridia bacterium]